MPETTHTPQGTPRRVGVELEFAGMELQAIAELVEQLYGGRAVRESRFAQRVEDTPWGTFRIEIDTGLLKDRSYARFLRKLGFNIDADPYRERVDDVLARVAATVVPHEIVTPPLPMADLHRLEALRQALRDHQALGTRASLFYAFGLHLNPEAASLEASSLLAHLRAFFLLYDWLQVEGEIDWARRVTPFINDFPHAYRRLVLEPDYAPDQATLIDDYVFHNPTRNRVLDMLPLFAFVDEELALRGVPEAHMVSARPAFHYRLPNCRIDEAGWSLAREWRGWVTVEWLAARPEILAEMTGAYLQRRPPAVARIDQEWAADTRGWLPG